MDSEKYRLSLSLLKKLAREHPLIVLAFCWAHTMRHFINTSHGNPGLQRWSYAWLERIGRFYYFNGQRLTVRENPRQWTT